MTLKSFRTNSSIVPGLNHGGSSHHTLNLNFITQERLDPRISFSRSSPATRVNRSGYLEVVSNDTPRFDYDPITRQCLGVLMEEPRSNILRHSNDFGNAVWTSVSATPTKTQNVTGPDGILNSAWALDDQYIPVDGAAIEQNISITPSATNVYCFSIWAKQGTATLFELYAFFTGSTTRASRLTYDWTTDSLTVGASEGPGVVPTVFGKIPYRNGWYRFYFIVTDANSGLNNAIQFRIYPAGRSAGNLGTTLFYGAQLERCFVGAMDTYFLTSYIPTTTVAVSRSEEFMQMTGSNFSNWYNQTEGTFTVESEFFTRTSTIENYPRIVAAVGANPDLDEIVPLYTRTLVSGSTFTGGFYNGTTVNAVGYGTAEFIDIKDAGKCAFAFKANDLAYAVNGFNALTATSAALPTVNALRIFGRARYQIPPSGRIKNIQYYPKRLSNLDIRALSLP